jgi:hypothetical protein
VKSLPEVEALVGALPDTSLPAVLLPVQIQTRFVTRNDVAQLLVRVYPDELHLDGHEPALTAAEVEWGKRVWRLAWPKRGDPEGERLAWTQLAARFGRRRAEWIARRLRPTNLGQRPQQQPVFPKTGALRDLDDVTPVMARRLPDRWIVMGYVGGQRVIIEAGGPIARDLPVGPSFDETPLPDKGPDELPLDPGMAWLVDFAEAEKVGMGITVELPPELVGERIDTLLVFGFRSLTAVGGASRLEALLDAQRYTRGLSFVAPGTPTNNTAEASSGFSGVDHDAGASFESVPVAAKAGTAAAIAARGLGIKADVVAGLEGAGRTDDLDARHLQNALWPVTGGYYLDQVFGTPAGEPARFPPEQLDAARRHVADAVRPLGPLPTVRAGRQPYGLLPAISVHLLESSGAGGDDRFIRSVRDLKQVWRAALTEVPRLAQGPDALVELLRVQPSSVGYRVRLAVDGQFFAPAPVFSSTLSPHLQSHAQVLGARLEQLGLFGLFLQGRFFDLIPADSAVEFRGPLVGAAPAGYLAFLRTASFDDILQERLPPSVPPGSADALLYLLLRHSVLLAYATTARRILVRRGTLPDQPYREPVLVDVIGGQVPDTTPTLLRAATSDAALHGSLHTLTKAQEPEAAALEELRASLRHLEGLPADVLERQLGSTLDLWAYRLDAWITSLATRRLDELRKATPRGLALGGFGWVHDLEPTPRPPAETIPEGEGGAPLAAAREAGGFLQAPSLAQAATAAVLRSGYLAHASQADAGALAIDLSSERVRLAESLLDGIRQGQQLGALLGYRFERRLHERGLDRFIDDFRRLALLAGVYGAQEALQEAESLPGGFERIQRIRAAQQALAAALAAVRERGLLPPTATVADLEEVVSAKVVDGLALARLLPGGGTGFLLDRLGVPLGSADRTALEAELAALDQAVDALSDALTAEGVYQLVRGNPARASATVDAVAHGEIQPPELHFTETPRPGVALTHRLAAVFSGPAPAVPAGGARTARRAAEPNLDRWLRQLIGEPKLVRCRAELVGADGEVLLARENVRLTPLGLSSLDALYLSASAEPGQPSDLERLLEHRLRRGVPAGVPADARVRFDYGRTAATLPGELSLGEFLELNAAFRAAILGARALDARDFVQATSGTAPGVDDAELKARAQRSLAALRDAHTALGTQLAAAEAEPQGAPLDKLRERLVDLVFLGVHEAVPLSASGDAAASTLLAQARSVEAEAARRLAAAEAAADPREQIEAVFGRGFRVLPLVRPPNAAGIGKALAASDQLLGGDALEALSWLQGVSRVRPGAARLAGALGYAAALERPSALELKVAQLPFVAGERWIGLEPAAGKPFPPGKLSVVAHLPRPLRPAQPLAGLVLDEWVETVPAPEVTTGLAFNFDAPGARPPQVILLAVAPPGAPRWTLFTLEQTLLETLDLAQLRTVDPQVLGNDDAYRRALPAVYVSGNLAGEALSTDFARGM